jgi:TonB family protein
MMAAWFMTISAALTAQPIPTPMPPFTKWTVDHTESSCRATRKFGSDGTGATLTVSTIPTQSAFVFSLIVPRAGKGKKDQHGQATVILSPSGQKATAAYSSASSDDGSRQLELFMPRAAISDLATSTEITIDADEPRSLALTSMAPLLHALGDCENGFLAMWGVDGSAESAPAVSAAPKGEMIPIAFGPNAYPADALASKAEGISVALLSIDAKGKVSACGIINSSGNTSLDRATCAAFLGHGASFHPAQDSQGAAVASKLVMPVSWTSPDHAARAEIAAPASIIVSH